MKKKYIYGLILAIFSVHCVSQKRSKTQPTPITHPVSGASNSPSLPNAPLSPDLAFLFSEQLSFYNDTEESLGLYITVFETSPNFPAGIKIAESLFNLKKYKECQAFSKKLNALFFQEIQTFHILSKCQFALDHVDLSLKTLNEALKREPDNEETMQLMVSILLKSRQFQKAQNQLETFVKLYPEAYSLRILKAKIAYEDAQYKLALDLSEELVKKWPDSAQAYALIGLSALKLKDTKKASDALQEAFNRQPDNISIVGELLYLLEESNKIVEQIQVIKKLEARLNDDLPRSLTFRLSQLLIQNDQYGLAQQYLKDLSATETDEDKQEDYQLLLGLASESLNQPLEALNHYSKVTAHASKRKIALKRIFALSVKMKNWTLAEKALYDFKNYLNDGTEEGLFYASGLWELGKKEDSIHATKELALKNPGYPPIRLLEVNQTYFDNPYNPSSLQALIKLSEEFPKDAEVLNHAGYTLLHTQSPDSITKGKQLIEQALAVSPQNLFFMDSLGWAYYVLQDYEKADPLLTMAAQKLPDEAIVIYHLAQLRFTQGHYQEAKKLFLKAQNLIDGERNTLRPKDLEESLVYTSIGTKLNEIKSMP